MLVFAEVAPNTIFKQNTEGAVPTAVPTPIATNVPASVEAPESSQLLTTAADSSTGQVCFNSCCTVTFFKFFADILGLF